MECPVCFEIFETPLLLPGCGHTICRACAEALITEGNYLRCPECRLVYQLRQGIKSLPKNVALERTIEESITNPGGRSNIRCKEHPDDAIALYCKTCEESICLKCYFTNTLRRGQVTHSGHQVDTSEDAFTREKRLLEEARRTYGEQRGRERDYVVELEKTEKKLKEILDEKLESIENDKTEIISQVKQTTSKLKFTLKGSMVRDSEFLQMALQTSRDRLERLETAVNRADDVLLQIALNDHLEDVNTLKDARKAMEELSDHGDSEKGQVDSFLKIDRFDTNVSVCLDDPKKALSYQTEPPRTPEIVQDECVISDILSHIQIHYNQTVRIKSLTLYYKEAMYKGFSEKQWTSVEVQQFSKGAASALVRGLKRGTMYRMYCVASNDFGDSPQSPELWFRTVDAEIEMRRT